MGMFDWVKVEDEINLPLPENFTLDIKDLEFQTKSLDKLMNLYIIGNDKHLYMESSSEEDPNLRRHRMDFHGTITFYAYHQTDLTDYILDYKAKFTDGLLDKIDLVNYEMIDHESSKLKREKFLESVKKENNKLKNKIPLVLGKFLIVYPLKIFGIKVENNSPGCFRSERHMLSFHIPEIIVGCGKDSLKRSTYGISLGKVTTEICFRKSVIGKEFSFLILGIGFIVSKFKKFDEVLMDS